ncbi:protein FAM162A isoform X1 [Ascaphus truei]|uniref:protein FAM162A isoform X1 n=1 Tax=Ascaphus truei TaxID=8439 RepID=UPI003F5ABD1E
MGHRDTQPLKCLQAVAERSAVLRWRAVPLPKPLSAQDPVTRRWLCSKPEADKPKEAGASFRIPGHKPSNFEKNILVYAGRFKKKEDIPDLVSYEMVDMAKSKMRVKVAYMMMALTIIGCIATVISGKRAAGRHESLSSFNLEKKARLREEAQREESSIKPE